MERSLSQQSEQNANNLAAMADPAAAGMFAANMQLAGGAPYGSGGGANTGQAILSGLDKPERLPLDQFGKSGCNREQPLRARNLRDWIQHMGSHNASQ